MSKLLDNKQMIHIAAEIVILIGVTFYFSQKNRKLMVHIEDLTLRLEEQDELLQNHEKVLQKLVAHVSGTPVASKTMVKPTASKPVKPATAKPATKTSKPVTKPAPTPPAPAPASAPIDDSESDTSDALDEELADELRELEVNIPASKTAVVEDEDDDDVIEVDTSKPDN